MNPYYSHAEAGQPDLATGPATFVTTDTHDTTGNNVENDRHMHAPPPSKRASKREAPSHLRKAPQAPRRFKSNYILFFMDKQDEIKAELGPGASVGEVSKRSSEMWSKLSKEERAPWDQKAKEDKERYNLEKAAYTGPWQVPWRRAKKDPSAPKRPMSAFLFFSQHKRRLIKEANPGMRNTEISRTLGQMWREASDEERAPHIEREAKEREKYKLEIAKWRIEDAQKKKEEKKEKIEQSRRSVVQQNTPQTYAPYVPPEFRAGESRYSFPPSVPKQSHHPPSQHPQSSGTQNMHPPHHDSTSYGPNYDYYQHPTHPQGYGQPNPQYGQNYGYAPVPPNTGPQSDQSRYFYPSGYPLNTSSGDAQTVSSSHSNASYHQPTNIKTSEEPLPSQTSSGYPAPENAFSEEKPSLSSGSGYTSHGESSQPSGHYNASYSNYPPPQSQSHHYHPNAPQSYPESYEEYPNNSAP